ncbi:MAG: YbaN family protein [bacterium]|nr:YbaN family protein [bacterium]
MNKFFFLSIGYTSIALALIGIPLPILPSTPFALLACFCFAKSSPEIQARIENSKLFGKSISDWRTSRSISLKSRILATLLISLSSLSTLYSSLSYFLKGIMAIFFLGMLVFLWTRRYPKIAVPPSISSLPNETVDFKG